MRIAVLAPLFLSSVAACTPFHEARFGAGRALHWRKFHHPAQVTAAPAHGMRHPTPLPPRSCTLTPPSATAAAGLWSLTPGAKGVAAHVANPPAHLAFEWDFEPESAAPSGSMMGWTAAPKDMPFAPNCGRISPARLPNGPALERDIGGDYWENTYWAGHSGECFLDTGDRDVTLTSPRFVLGPQSAHLSYLVGGGGDGNAVWLEADGLLPGREHAVFVDEGPGTLGMVRRDRTVDPSLFGRGARFVVRGHGGAGILLDDVAGSADALDWQQPDGPVWGFVDLHNHVFNHLTFGGRLITGRVTERPLSMDFRAGLRDEEGIVHALEGCEQSHGSFFAPYAFSLTTEFLHDRHGFPTFDGWPRATTTVHEQAYVDWLRRAWMGGLRLIHLDAGNSAFSAQIFEEANFWLTGNRRPLYSDDSGAIERTLDAVHEFVAGEGRGWAAIAYGPADARRIIGQGKLALVLGTEVDALGDFFTECPHDVRLFRDLQERPCHTLPRDPAEVRAVVRAMLEHLYRRGVTHIVPIHMIENAFGYPAVYNRAFDINSAWANGTYFPLQNGWNRHVRFRLDDDFVDGNSTLTWAMSFLGDVDATFDPRRLVGGPLRDPRMGHISSAGLKPPGRVLLDEMMRLGMLIDIQHMGEAATDEALDLAKQRGYPVVLTHTGFRELSFGYSAPVGWDPRRSAQTVLAYDTSQVERIANDALKSPEQVDELRSLGGFVGVGLSTSSVAASWGRPEGDFCDDTSTTWASSYLYAVDHLGGRGVGLGSDTNGLATLPKPRFGTKACQGASGDDVRATLMHDMASAQRNGVKYDPAFGMNGVSDAGSARFGESGDGWAYSAAEREVWEGLAEAEAARTAPTVSDAFRFIAYYDQRAPFRIPAEAGRVRRYAKGFWVKEHDAGYDQLDSCVDGCDEMDNCLYLCPGRDKLERAAYAAFPSGAYTGGHEDELPFVKGVVDAWLRMHGTNKPMHKYVVHGRAAGGQWVDRDFDMNLEGMAHYGLLPDFLQDVKNIGLNEQQLAPLFMGAEDYIEMWEHVEKRSRALYGSLPAELAEGRGP